MKVWNLLRILNYQLATLFFRRGMRGQSSARTFRVASVLCFRCPRRHPPCRFRLAIQDRAVRVPRPLDPLRRHRRRRRPYRRPCTCSSRRPTVWWPKTERSVCPSENNRRRKRLCHRPLSARPPSARDRPRRPFVW